MKKKQQIPDISKLKDIIKDFYNIPEEPKKEKVIMFYGYEDEEGNIHSAFLDALDKAFKEKAKEMENQKEQPKRKKFSDVFGRF